jgi:F-type H+-transporting ATPase subunit epsilon
VTGLRLLIRAPEGLLYEGEVSRVVAEDLDGWFGIRPGRADLLSALAPGLLIFEDAEGEGYLALVAGLLDLRAGVCRVMSREAVLSRDLSSLTERVEANRRSGEVGGDRQRDVVDDLAREALVRIAREARR